MLLLKVDFHWSYSQSSLCLVYKNMWAAYAIVTVQEKTCIYFYVTYLGTVNKSNPRS